MRTLAWALGLLVLTACPAVAQDGEDFAAIQKEMNTTRSKLITEWRSAEGDAKKELYDKITNMPKEYAGRFLAVAKAKPEDSNALTALQMAATAQAGETSAEAIKMMKEQFIDDPKLVQLCKTMTRGGDDAVNELVSAVAEAAKKAEDKGALMFVLASRLNDQAGRSGDIQKAEKAEELFGVVKEKYADLKDPRVGRGQALGPQATQQLDLLKKLGVGKSAPEIAAQDTDGVDFKLSDYRGKVVLLDFWGHW